jgi:hypothetical protein
MADHDNGYKLLFSHPAMVEDLLRGFVHEDWVAELDFATLEKVSGTFVADDLRDREDDVIWRVRWGREWLYVYLLLEFQSRTDRFMAVRMLTYVGLLYQELVRGAQLSECGKLPPVLPLVLYNGSSRWRAATEVAELIEAIPGGLERYRPRMCYLLLDQGALEESALAAVRNLAGALFRLERSRQPEDLRDAVAALADWLRAPEQNGLRRAFTVWIKRVLLPARLPGVVIPEIVDLQEVKNMLAERVVEWTKEWKQQGLQEGLLQGVQQGLQQGLLQGVQQGVQQGEAAVLLRQIELKFGPPDEAMRRRIEQADAATLLRWSERILTADRVEAIFH